MPLMPTSCMLHVVWSSAVLSACHGRYVGAMHVQAAKRRAVTELLFFASVGDLRRCQRIVRLWKLKVAPFATMPYLPSDIACPGQSSAECA